MLKKIISLTVAVIAIGVTALVATKPSTKVSFAATEWTAAQQQAKTEKKLFFVDFDASYCATCRNMEQSTYMDNNLANFMSQNVVALRVDVQDFDGVMWSQQYEVEALPTMLVFDGDGKLLHRLVGYQSASSLLKLFQQAKTPAPAPEPLVNNNPTPKPNPAPVPADQPINGNTAGKTAPSLFGMPKVSSSASASPLGLFEIVVSRAQRKGFSLQVGAFANYETALDQADMMRERYAQKTILCVDKNSENTSYKLFVGVFETRDEAEKFQNILRKNKMDGLIRDLTTI